MSETLRARQTNQSPDLSEKYFSFQVKGWTNFDPTDKTLAKVAEGVEQGDGFVTLVEVLKVESELAGIDDLEVRECFENLLAAKRLIQKFNELPARLKAELRAALKTEEEEIAPRKIVTLMPGSSASDESASRAKRWP